jgi:hypothetical protein
MTDGTNLELHKLDEEFHTFFTTGPVVAFQRPPHPGSGRDIEAPLP